MTTAINLNIAFYFGIFENYSMNGSFRLKNEEKCKYSGWMLTPMCSQKRKYRAVSVHSQGCITECDLGDITTWSATLPLGRV